MKISRRSALGILATTATASAIETPAPEPQAPESGNGPRLGRPFPMDVSSN